MTGVQTCALPIYEWHHAVSQHEPDRRVKCHTAEGAEGAAWNLSSTIFPWHAEHSWAVTLTDVLPTSERCPACWDEAKQRFDCNVCGDMGFVGRPLPLTLTGDLAEAPL